jgi:fructose-bisphosphate aldolase class II
MSLVLSYSEAKKVFEKAKAEKFALPAVNVTTSNTINATLEAAKAVNSPTIIQFSNSGAGYVEKRGGVL